MADQKSRFNVSRSILIPALSGAVGALASAILIGISVYSFTGFKFLNQDSCGTYNGNSFCILDDRWDTETYLSTISSFYGTIITILIGLLAFVAAFAFFAVRASALSHAEDKVGEEVQRYFTDSKIGDAKVSSILRELTTERDRSLASRLDNLETQLSEQGFINLDDIEAGE